MWKATGMKTRISARGKDFPEEKLLLCNAAARKKQETLVMLSVLYCGEAQEKTTGWRKAENIFGCLYHWHVIMCLSSPPHHNHHYIIS